MKPRLPIADVRYTPFGRMALVLALVAAALLCAPLVAAEIGDDDSENSSSARDQLYAGLAEDVEALARQMGILKRVVKLVQPTVLHIEAKHQEGDERFARRTVEEAGSGVIIEWRRQHYVLTNRHVIKGASREQI